MGQFRRLCVTGLFGLALLEIGCVRRAVAPSAQEPASRVPEPPAPARGAVPAQAASLAAVPAPGEHGPQKKKKAKKGKRYTTPPLSHQEALQRQLDASWAPRSDKDRQVELPLADHRHWKRVRFLGMEHLTGFQYGPERHVVTSAFVVRAEPGERPSSRTCMERFERTGLAKFKRHKGRFTPILESTGAWRKEPLLIHQADGRLTVFFSRYEFSAAWAAYPAYEDGCLIYATVVFWGDDKELAQRVRERWIEQAFGGVRTRTELVPSRKE